MVVAAAVADLGFAISWQVEERTLSASQMGEAELARAAARGDRTAFGRLVDLHKRAVFGLCVRVLRDPELRARLSDAARRDAARYDIRECVRQMESLYEEVLAENPLTAEC